MTDSTDDIQKVPSTTPDFQTELAKQLQQLAPEAVADGKIDVKKLQELLDLDTTDDSERFGLFWPGKKRAVRAAQEPTTATLKPAKDESKDWDATENIFIEGDNLETLKILQKYYHNKIKMIYIDPPYNTGKDFVYPDNFKEGLANYLEFSKQVDEGGKKISTNSDTEGRYHSNWLNMMYPRIKTSRNLLTDDGVIFISVDDNEVDNLKKVCHEIFGEDNHIATLVWEGTGKNDSHYISVAHDYILVYARNVNALKESKPVWRQRKKGIDAIYKKVNDLRALTGDNFEQVSLELKKWFSELPKTDPSWAHRHYNNADERGAFFASDISWPGGGGPRYEVLHPLTKKPVAIPSRGWVYSKAETMQAKIAEGKVHFGKDETKVPTLKTYLIETEGTVAPGVIYKDRRAAKQKLIRLMGGDYFDTPKDVDTIKDLIELNTSGNDIILDFFSGSGTTAEAVMTLNAEDFANRRNIQVQLPEPTDPKSEAFKAGFTTISDISKERIRRAGDKIKLDFSKNISEREDTLDTGFKVFKLADSNFKKWQSASETDKDSLQQHLLDIRESSNDAATEEELLTEVLLKQGISLTANLKHEDISGLSVWNVGDTTVLAYLNEHVKPTLDQLRAVASAEPAKITILEDAFKGDDELKTNLAQICKTNKIELWTV